MRPAPVDDGVFECSVHYDGDDRALSAAEARRARRFTEKLARQWGAAISARLGVWPPAPIRILLRPGLPSAMTRGTDVVIGVSQGVVSAALAHELVHAVAGPSRSQLYGEGLAVHVDAELQLAGPTWPFFHLRPHRWARSFVDDGTFVPLGELFGSAPVGPTREAGLSGAARFYLEAGSFVGFVIESLGIDAMWSHFHTASSIPLPDLAVLERRWLAHLGPSLGADERARRDASMPLLADDGRHGLASPVLTEEGW